MVPAHIALFHHLPGESLDKVRSDAGHSGTIPFDVRITRLRSLGRGVALVLEAPPLIALHRELSRLWQQWLTPQDRQNFTPHITIQNKAEPAQARQLLRKLEQRFTPFDVHATGIDIWYYRSGPWEFAAHVPFLKWF